MRVEMSPAVYLALCGLVKDAMEVDSDATPVLQRAAAELASAMRAGGQPVPEIIARAADAITELGETGRTAAKQSSAA